MLRRSMTPRPAKCAHCKTRLERVGQRIHEACVDPWLLANHDANKAKAERKKKRAAALAKKQERAQDRAKLEAMKSIPKLIAEAQFHFNEYTRLRDFDKGCYVCLRPFDQSIKGRAIHAGHVRSRGAAGHLRFTEDNCMGECEGCNAPHGAKPHNKEAGAIARIGQERFDALKHNNTPHKWTHDELRAIRDQYKAKAKAIKREAAL